MYLNIRPVILSIKKLITRCMALLSLVILSGCGESSGNAEPTAVIDKDNATAIVRTATASVFDLEEVGELGNLSDQYALDSASRSALSRSSRMALRTVIEPQTEECLVDGSLTISATIAGTETLTAGDVITLDADVCDNGEDEVIDGQMRITINKLTGDLSSSDFVLAVKAVFSDFSVTESNDKTALNGDVSITLDMAAETTQMQLSGNSLTVSSMGETQSISNFSNSYTVDLSVSPVTWEYDSQGTIIGSDFVGTINYQMPVKFTGSGVNNPDSGELLITGANNTSLHLRTISDVYIEVDADYDGDGDIDATFYITWLELNQ